MVSKLFVVEGFLEVDKQQWSCGASEYQEGWKVSHGLVSYTREEETKMIITFERTRQREREREREMIIFEIGMWETILFVGDPKQNRATFV